jgi:hypothetical protein
MPLTVFSSVGGTIVLPEAAALLCDRADGGNLVVNPPRPVWERSELSPEELWGFSALVAAAGRAMIDALPQLDGGCVNYWEAGNWALNDDAPPAGRKRADAHRAMHLHLLGRSPACLNPDWAWGESPVFPRYAERGNFPARKRLDPAEVAAVLARAEAALVGKYRFADADIARRAACRSCGYPFTPPQGETCPQCA